MNEKPKTADDSYKRWRFIILLITFIGYCLYYTTRNSSTSAIPLLLDDKSLSLTNEVFGIMASTQMLSYSIGKLTCGILSDNYSSKLMFSIGMFLCGISNILFAFCSHSYQFIMLWAFNGFFQGCGWAPIVILIKRWYLPTEIGTIWSIMSAAINIGSSIIPIIMITLSDLFDWRTSFALIGMVSCTSSLISFTFIKDHPSELIGENSPQNGIGNNKKRTTNKTEDTQGSYLDLLSSKFLCLISFAYFLWTLVKNGIEFWLLVFLTGEKSLTAYQASFSMMYFQIGGLVATLSSGFVSDLFMTKLKGKRMSSPRLPLVIFYTSFILCWLYLLQSRFVTDYIFINITCFFLGLCCYGPMTLFGLLVVENAPPGLSGTAHAIAATASTVGSVFAGYPLSFLSNSYSWVVVFVLLSFVATLVSMILLLATRLSCKIGIFKED